MDTEKLESSRAEELARLVEAGSDGLAGAEKPRSRADRFRYLLTVEDAGRERTLHFGEEDAPETLRRLVEAVWREGELEPPGAQKA